MRGERVTKGGARRSLRDARPPHRLLHSALKHGFVQVMPAALARLPVDVDTRGRKHPLPRPLAAGVRVLPGQRPRELHPAGAVPEIGFVLPPDHLDMPNEIGSHYGGQHRHAVAVALAGPPDELIGCEIHVLHPEAGISYATPPAAGE